VYQSLYCYYDGRLLCGFNVAIKGLMYSGRIKMLELACLARFFALPVVMLGTSFFQIATLSFFSLILSFHETWDIWSIAKTQKNTGTDEWWLGQAAADPQTKPTDLGRQSRPPVGCYSLHPLTGTLAVDGWAVTFGTARRGLTGLRPRPVPSSLYQM